MKDFPRTLPTEKRSVDGIKSARKSDLTPLLEGDRKIDLRKSELLVEGIPVSSSRRRKISEDFWDGTKGSQLPYLFPQDRELLPGV